MPNVLIYFLATDKHTIEYIVSVRGKMQLMIDGHRYFRNKADHEKESFYCCKKKNFR